MGSTIKEGKASGNRGLVLDFLKAADTVVTNGILKKCLLKHLEITKFRKIGRLQHIVFCYTNEAIEEI